MSQETTNSQTILTNILPKVAQSSKAMASDSPQSFSILTSSLSSGNVQTYSQPEQLKQQMNEERERRRKRSLFLESVSLRLMFLIFFAFYCHLVLMNLFVV
jgi:hypothetical protein